MADEVVELAVYSNIVEAQIARGRLDAEGIRAELDGESGAGPLPGMEAVFASIRLLVPEAEARRAAAILGFSEEEADEPEPEATDDPTLTAIREPGGKGIREPREHERPPDRNIRPATPEELQARAEGPPPEPLEDEDREDVRNRRFTWTAEELASRAFHTAVVGVMLFAVPAVWAPLLMWLPLLLNFYSLWLLVRMALLPEDVSPAGMRRMYGALAVNLGVLAWCGITVLRIVYR